MTVSLKVCLNHLVVQKSLEEKAAQPARMSHTAGPRWQAPLAMARAHGGVSANCGAKAEQPTSSKPHPALRYVNTLNCTQERLPMVRPEQERCTGVLSCSLPALINTGCSPVTPQTSNSGKAWPQQGSTEQDFLWKGS